MASNDSREEAHKWYRKIHLDWLFNTSTFLGNLFIALVVTYFFRQLNYGDAVDYVFLIAVLAVGLWITEAIPPFAVGILIICMLLFGFGTDYLMDEPSPVDIYISTWTSNVMWLLLGGFFLAEGMKQVELDRSLFQFAVKRFGSRPESLLMGIMVVTALASMVMSNTATTAMMISSVLPLVYVLGKEANYSKALLTGIPAASTIGGIGTIIGSTPNAIAVGALQEKGWNITFIDWMLVGMPTALLLIYLFFRFLNYKLHIHSASIDLSLLPRSTRAIDPVKRKSVIFTLIVTVLLWLTESIHGIPVAATSAVPILLLTLTQVIQAEQVRSIPWDTLMLVAGGLALGIALVEVGLANILMNEINRLPIGGVIISMLFSLVGVLLSNVMSNTAAASILIPLGLTLPLPFSVAVPVMVAISCSSALLLPVSTPSNAIAYATGLLEQKEFRRGGLFFMVAGPVAAFISVILWVWLYLQV
ncbi:MAG: DASS family sodium-coupled anion symporter [Cyclobacteriaceae bacterium]|jgi:sodium-dependent dicarboxylate transporter 2/3/5|nr:DASS family sodium-coupled anion symporter [Cyclobacteriaceae bacterium]